MPPTGSPRARLLDLRIDVALAHGLAAVRAREVHAVALGRGDEAANLLEPLGSQPFLAAPALHGEAVRCLLVGPAELVPALMGVDPQLDGRRDLVEELGVEDEEARIRGAVIVEVGVDNRGTLAAYLPPSVELQLPDSHDLGIAAHVRHVLFRGRAGLGGHPRQRAQHQGKRNPRPPPRLPPAKSCAPQVRNALVNPSLQQHHGVFTPGMQPGAWPWFATAAPVCRSQSLTEVSMRSMSASDKPK